jgi:hypothetical protein
LSLFAPLSTIDPRLTKIVFASRDINSATVFSLTEEGFSVDGSATAKMHSPLSLQTVVVASRDQVSCQLGEESSVLSLKNSVYYGLDAVGARVWNLLRSTRSVEEIRDLLLQEYDVLPEQCERDLFDLLEKLRSEGLIEVVELKIS